jgi:hypothetical protein
MQSGSISGYPAFVAAELLFIGRILNEMRKFGADRHRLIQIKAAALLPRPMIR